MKSFVLILLFGANTSANGPAIIDGFTTQAACENAAEKIISTFNGGFTPDSDRPLNAQFKCVGISKG